MGADKPSEMRAVNLLPPDLRSGPKGPAPAVASGVEPRLAPLATAYVLITVVSGPLLARLPDYGWFKGFIRRRMALGRQSVQPVTTGD